MPRYFLDTSGFVKRYRHEAGSDFIDNLFANPDNRLLLSRLGAVETISALAMKVRVGELTSDSYMAARKRLLSDVAVGRPSVVRMTVGHYRQAEVLLDQHATTSRLRTLDAVQLGVALTLRQSDRIDAFVSADNVLCLIAEKCQLTAINPLNQ